MPYYVVNKGTTGFGMSDPMFADRASAFAHLLVTSNVQTSEVYFYCSDDDKYTWRQGMHNRFSTNHYVWSPFWESLRSVIGGPNTTVEQSDRLWSLLNSLHFPHLAIEPEHAGQIAYTPDWEYAMADKFKTCSPGRYLKKYYGEILSDAQVETMVALCAAYSQALTIKIATSTEDIVRIYRRKDAIAVNDETLHSCMSPGTHCQHMEPHPVSVYGESDLAVAYLGTLDYPIARSVVWPAKKTFWRIYEPGGRLRALLTADGWKQRSPEGARIRHISHPSQSRTVIMPYVDGDSLFAEICDDKWLVLDHGGAIVTLTQHGYAKHNSRPCDDDDEEDDQPGFHCGNCNDYTYEGDSESSAYCQECYDTSRMCCECNEDFWGDAYDVEGEYCCPSCWDNVSTECADENCDHRWHEATEFDADEREARKRMEVSDLCLSCASKYVYCEVCETAYDDQYCPTCGRSPRCEKTIALPLISPHDAAMEALAEADRQYDIDHPTTMHIGDDGSINLHAEVPSDAF